MPAPVDTARALAPGPNAKMIVIKEPYTGHILRGEKTHELRCRRLLGRYYLADSTTHTVKAILDFGESRELTQEDYQASKERHRCDCVSKPYRRTWSTEIVGVQPLAEAVPYKPKRGAVGFARYQETTSSSHANGGEND